MYSTNGQLFYSPSDLTCFMESPFASWMDRYVIEYPAQAPAADPPDDLLQALAKQGLAHEQAIEKKFVQQGLDFIAIQGQSSVEKRTATWQAMRAGIAVIAQARLEIDEFGGYSDFLVRVPGSSSLGNYHYEVWDAKLAARAKPSFLIQLCGYAHMLEAVQGRRPDSLTIALGTGERLQFQTHACYAYFHTLQRAFLKAQSAFDPHQPPDPAHYANWGNWSTYAQQQLLERDHMFQVATITQTQIKHLHNAGLTTMTQLAQTKLDHIKGIAPAIITRLQRQAALQLRTHQRQITATNKTVQPCFEILQPNPGQQTGLALLPPHSPLDVFFDIEGFPLDSGGLEYLWGATFFASNGQREFKALWAHNREQEQQAFEAFIGWVFKRWQQDPSMHIYHYANYEIATCRKLMGRYGRCEDEVDQLLRNQVFVDLFKIVKTGLLLGEPRYSIKNVERLYRAQRDTDVGNGSDSVVVYEQWRALHAIGEQGDTWQTSSILNSLRQYNMDDCHSTQELTVWLREQQIKHAIPYVTISEPAEPVVQEAITARIALRDQLLTQSKLSVNPTQAALSANIAWLLEFHRREAKPVSWRLFERLGLNHLDLLDDLDCLAACERTGTTAYKPSAQARNLAYEYKFDPTQEFKGAVSTFYLLGVEGDNGKTATVNVLNDASDLDNGFITLQAKVEPPRLISLVPNEYVNPNPIPKAIDQSAQAYASGELAIGSHQHPQSAIMDLLTRARPRFTAEFQMPAAGIAPSQLASLRLEQIITAVRCLDGSYLTIQGPPGAGKSYTGKHIIAALLQDGARIGITSNSHKAINNLVLSTAKHCQAHSISASFACTKATEDSLATYQIAVLNNKNIHAHLQPSCVIGTTAWGFARQELAGQFDYLFVDEAGQVAVANVIAMSRATRNIVFLGDQMQLGQPTQASHPGESGLSVLDYLLHQSPTIPADMGIFLDTTYRMHSSINQFISRHIYAGKLQANAQNDQRIIEVPPDYHGPLTKSAGIVFVPVEHTGNSQASPEEVCRIQALAQDLLGRIYHTGYNAEPTRLITWEDMLFVAPYNHQVNKLRQVLGTQAKVGSVDKFQGQEAPIVVLSMCASDPTSSRGLEFLFDRQRLNVALSRAQTLAIVVANPGICLATPTSIEQLRLINLVCALQD